MPDVKDVSDGVEQAEGPNFQGVRLAEDRGCVAVLKALVLLSDGRDKLPIRILRVVYHHLLQPQILVIKKFGHVTWGSAVAIDETLHIRELVVD